MDDTEDDEPIERPHGVDISEEGKNYYCGDQDDDAVRP
jgi:hypothetical protein